MDLFQNPQRSEQPTEAKYRATGLRDIPPAEFVQYGAWINSTWPADALILMGNHRDDSDSPRGHELYLGVLFHRAIQVRTGTPWPGLASDPGSFASSDVNNLLPLPSGQGKTIREIQAANDAAVPKWYSAEMLGQAWDDRKKQLSEMLGLGVEKTQWVLWGLAAVLGLGLVWYFLIGRAIRK